MGRHAFGRKELHVRRVGLATAAVGLLVSVSPLLAAAPADPRSEYGVTLAVSGEQARAESIFVSMLSHTRGDTRALNNLGNLRLLRGETGVALAFYERALKGDSLDAGIHLNRATALMLLGDQVRSEQAFAVGVKLAGGLEHAQALLGLTPEKQPTEKAAKKTVIDPDQLRAMLKHAATSVPKDSLRLLDSNLASENNGKKVSTWRSAGARASDGGDTPLILYWKR
jgi:tetratricopeptide (TPR) repeat protein